MTSFPACATGYRIRTRPLCAPGAIGMNDNLRFHQCAALPLPSLGSGKREPVECGGPIHALRAPAVFPTLRDMWSGFLNLTGYLSRWSFRSCVQDCSQAPHGFFRSFKFSPASLSSVAHEGNNGRRKRQGVVT